ncbi:hypothetical protein VTN77DRAFT_2171 [Rasamsonia byssochlamydoides]|uniref:uncharacterized protein n=1 Tax=Rasamsonia byssochlamydoides TaxID=89139 RepID=UPI00374342BA
MSAPSSPPGHRSGSHTSRQSDTTYHPTPEWLHDEDDAENDQDMDYEPESERSENLEYLDEDDEDDDDYDDVHELFNESGIGDFQVEFTMEPSDTEHAGEGQGARPRVTRVTSAQIIQFLGANSLRRILQSHGMLSGTLTADDYDDDDDNDEEYGLHYGGYRVRVRRRRRDRPAEDVFPKVPSDVGTELMGSGLYGSNPHYVDELKQRKKRLATKLMWRELGIGTVGAQKRDVRSVFQDMIPSSTPDKIIHFDSRCYSGQFSDDGNFFFCCSQDFRVRMYDTSNPFEWKYYKTVNYPFGQWTITDATLSPDNKYLAYSSIRHLVCLAPTDPNDHSDPILLDFSNMRRRAGGYGNSHFGIWSLRFSGDGREIVAGTSDRSVIVYDIETRQSILRLQNHDDDVNAVCFGDSSSPHILYSGSDDTTLRVWDRRSMGDGREAGVFMGHTEGLTYVDSKGDGRYVLSNGKDQLMKLWDLRKMMTTAEFDKIDPSRYTTGFDYRFMSYSEEDYQPHPHDCSVVTFRGHRVLKTLIRCHFSPPGSTNSRYVYSGSEDGKVYIYNLDATLAGTIDVENATRNSRPQDVDLFTTAYEMRGGDKRWRTCVRDASWHPNAPVLAATSWNGWGMSTGTCTVHTWTDSASEDEGDPPMGMSYNNKLEYSHEFNRFRDDIRRYYNRNPREGVDRDDEAMYENRGYDDW